MESQPQNPEFKNNPKNFYPCFYLDRLSMESQPKNPEFKNNPKNFYPCFYLDICGEA